MSAPERAGVKTPHRALSLTRRLTVAIIAIAIVFSAIAIVAQRFNTYSISTADSRRRLDEIGTSIVPSLAADVWQVDFDRARLLVAGIAHLPGVAYVRLTTREGERFERGDPNAEVLMRRSYALRHDDGGSVEVGALEVVIGAAQVAEEVRSQAIASGLVAAIVVTGSSLLLMLLLRRWVTRHLQTIASYASSLSFGNLETPLVLPGRPRRGPPDELDAVALAFNRMRDRLRAELELRNQHEAELLVHRNALEDLVHARTAQLEEKTHALEMQKDEVQHLADIDNLTGVNGRRRFHELAAREVERCARSHRPVTLLMIDIDHFKRVNDEHGHAAGDRTLAAVGACLRRQVRRIDPIGRLGGEEFAVLLPETDVDAALRVAETVREAVAALRVATPEGQTLRLTISIGIGRLDGGEGDIDALLECADEGLYRAKRDGRNRVCIGTSNA